MYTHGSARTTYRCLSGSYIGATTVGSSSRCSSQTVMPHTFQLATRSLPQLFLLCCMVGRLLHATGSQSLCQSGWQSLSQRRLIAINCQLRAAILFHNSTYCLASSRSSFGMSSCHIFCCNCNFYFSISSLRLRVDFFFRLLATFGNTMCRFSPRTAGAAAAAAMSMSIWCLLLFVLNCHQCVFCAETQT